MKKKYLKLAFLILLISNRAVFAQGNLTNYKFDFGDGKPAAGFTKVNADAIYTKEKGFGFDFDTKPIMGNRAYFTPCLYLLMLLLSKL